jgi:hypothetical protein
MTAGLLLADLLPPTTTHENRLLRETLMEALSDAPVWPSCRRPAPGCVAAGWRDNSFGNGQKPACRSEPISREALRRCTPPQTTAAKLYAQIISRLINVKMC